MTKKDRIKIEGLVKAYNDAMGCQGPHSHDAKLIVMANYGDLALDILKRMLARERVTDQ